MNLDKSVLDKAFPKQILAKNTITSIDTRPRCSSITPQTRNYSQCKRRRKPFEDRKAKDSQEHSKILPLDDTKSKTLSKSDKNISSVYPSWLIERNDFMEVLETYEKLDTATVISILDKPPADRDTFELDIAIRWLRQIHFFQEIRYALLKGLVQTLMLMRIPRDSTLMQEGSEGDKFFVIITGEVGIYIQGQYLGVTEAVNVIGERSLFGNKKRAATVKALTDLAALEISFNRFSSILNKEKLREIEEIASLIRNLKLLGTWSPMKIKDFASQFITIPYSENQSIYSFGDPATSLYIVKEGIVSINIQLDLSYTHCWPKSYHLREKITTKKLCVKPVVHIKNGEANDLIQQQNRRTQAIAVKNSILYMIPKSVFEKFVSANSYNILLDEEKYIEDMNSTKFSIKNKMKRDNLMRTSLLKAIDAKNIPLYKKSKLRLVNSILEQKDQSLVIGDHKSMTLLPRKNNLFSGS